MKQLVTPYALYLIRQHCNIASIFVQIGRISKHIHSKMHLHRKFTARHI